MHFVMVDWKNTRLIILRFVKSKWEACVPGVRKLTKQCLHMQSLLFIYIQQSAESNCAFDCTGYQVEC